MNEIVTTLAAVFGVLDLFLGFLAWKFQHRIRGLTRPINVKSGQRNSMMLLGLGGVGKTTFVGALFANENANAALSTENYELYRTTFSLEDTNNPKKGRKYTLFVGDYRGQNLGQLVREFVLQQKKSFDPMSYGFINSLVLVVDLFPPTDHEDDEPLESQNEWDDSRVQMHIDQWNETALDAAFGLLTRDSLKYVCLYINKVDILIEDNRMRDSIRERFSELRQRLEQRAVMVNAEFHLVIGSASMGNGITQIRDGLFATSVPGKL